LNIARNLEAAGLERSPAEALAKAIGQSGDESVTRRDLDSAVASLRSELVTMRWALGPIAAGVLGTLLRVFGTL